MPGMARYILALDQGTTSSRAILFDHEGTPVSVAQREFPQVFPAPGLVDREPEASWASQLGTAQDALRQAGATARDVAAVGITNQRETTLVWERASGRPIHNAIVWQSRLTAPICDELIQRGLSETVRAKTGLVIDPYFSGTKLKWLLDNVAGARDRAERGELLFGTVDAFLLWRLSGGPIHPADYFNPSRTPLFNIHTPHLGHHPPHELRLPPAMPPRPPPPPHRL